MNKYDDQRQSPQEKSPTPWRLITFVAIGVVTLIFILQNRERTSIDFLVVELRARTWVALLIAVALGVVLDRLFTGWWRRRRQSRD